MSIVSGFATLYSTYETEEQLIAAMKERRSGPSFIQVLAKPGNKDVPTIPIHHFEIKKQVQEFLRK